jgi:hypothetical protein
VRGVVVGVAIALALTSCIVRNLVGGSRLTGTCHGACAHYVACKPSHDKHDARRCETECPDVFSDRDSLVAFESLSCQDAVEFVDGDPHRQATANTR